MPVQIQLRHDTAANWTSADPTLALGEVGIETDTDFFKFGDGATAWTGLAYAGGGSFTNPMTTAGDIIVADTGGAPLRLAKGSDAQVLTIDSGTHLPVWDNSASGFSNPMTTKGDIIIGDTGGTADRLGAGTSGYVLTSNGAAAFPSWQAAGGGGGGAPSTPVSSGLQIWLDASQLGLSDGDPISTFTDESGNGNDFTASGGARPTFKTGILNGLDIARFAGGIEMGAGDLSGIFTSAGSFFCVLDITSTGWNGLLQLTTGLDEHWNFGGTGYWAMLRSARDSGYPQIVPIDGAHLLCVVSSADLYEAVIDGQFPYVAAQTPAFGCGTISRLGDNTNGSLIGDLGELLMYDRVLNAWERKQNEAYLQNKWGLGY